MHVLWVLFVACLTCVIVGNVASVCSTVIIIVESFYVLWVDELSGGDMPPPWSLLLSSAGVAVYIAWIPTVSVVGIKEIQTATPVEDKSSDQRGGISPLENSSTPKT